MTLSWRVFSRSLQESSGGVSGGRRGGAAVRDHHGPVLRILCGISRPDAGSAQLDGHDPTHHPRPARRRLGCVPEQPPLFYLLTGGKHLMWVGRVYDIPDSVLRARIEELAAALELTDALPRRIGGYSNEAVFLDRVARDRVTRRLTTVASGSS